MTTNPENLPENTDQSVDDLVNTAQDENNDPAPEVEVAPDSSPEADAAAVRKQLEKEGDIAADYLEALLDIADIDGDLLVSIDGERPAVSIVDSEDGQVPRRLVGQEGQVLDALQEITRMAVQSEIGQRSYLMLDIANHRADMRAKVRKLAQEAIDNCKSTGEEVSMEYMTAFERKVVHDEVLASGLMSKSAGRDPRRYVIITQQ